jgi:hypothetical protein
MAILHTWISDDIKVILDWELSHGNELDRVYYPRGFPDGPPSVALRYPLTFRIEISPELVPASCEWWEFRDPHYGKSEWGAGYKSTETGHQVCGPIPPTQLP